MVFHDQISLMDLYKEGNVYLWKEAGRIWAKAETQNKNTIFSKVGWSAKAVIFSMYRRKITFFQALQWQGKHYVITDIQPDGIYLQVTAAQVTPVVCTVEYQGDPTMDEFNRPVLPEPEILSFPGCLTEKYMGFTQQMPQSTVETTFVLVTPKEIGLHSGQLVTVDGNHYNVQLCHTLDEFKNEYEINREEEPQCKTSG